MFTINASTDSRTRNSDKRTLRPIIISATEEPRFDPFHRRWYVSGYRWIESKARFSGNAVIHSFIDGHGDGGRHYRPDGSVKDEPAATDGQRQAA